MSASAMARLASLLLLATALGWLQNAWSADPATDPVYGCHYGYSQRGTTCIPVHVPEHAFLNSFGDDWTCDRGFQRDADRCERITVPAHGYLTDYGWECNRGFEKDGSS